VDKCKKKLLANNQIEAIYDNKMYLYSPHFTNIIIDDCTTCRGSKEVSLSLFNDIKKVSHIIQRIYYSKEILHDKQIGKVSYHKIFLLNEKQVGIAKVIHNLEYQIYKQNQIKEIQLHAICDGLIVWVRLGFSFSIKDTMYLVYEKFMEYLEVIQVLSETELDGIQTQFDFDVENGFRLIDKSLYFNSKQNFTDWFLSQNKKFSTLETHTPCVSMYKEII